MTDQATTTSGATVPADTTPRHYGVTPIKYKGQVCRWLVSFSRDGLRIQRTFSPSRYGGDLQAAFKAALAYRDEVMRTVPLLSQRAVNATLSSASTSGVPGVRRIVFKNRVYWLARMNIGRQVQQKMFGLNRYGEEQARALAIAARMDMLQQAVGWAVRHPDAKACGGEPPALDTPVRLPGRVRFPPAERRSNAPMPGVCRCVVRYTRVSGVEQELPYWIATFRTENGSYTNRRFSVLRFGEDAAKHKAMAQRLAWEQNPPPPPPPRRKSVGRSERGARYGT